MATKKRSPNLGFPDILPYCYDGTTAQTVI
jgi:hypothetical protein